MMTSLTQEEILAKIESLPPEHRDQLIQLALDNTENPNEAAVHALYDAGLILAGDDFVGIHPAVHMAVCEWCSQQEDE